jgi:outer membrane protein
MKTKLVVALLVVFLSGFAAKAQAQTSLKIGYTNVDYILSQLPEAKQIEAEYKAYEAQLQKQLQSKYQEFQQKVEVFQKNAATMAEAVRNDKQEELQNLQASIEKFQRDAEQSLQKKQLDLFQPAYDKIQKTIDVVAKENSFSHVFSSDAAGMPVLLYAAEEHNISDLVLKKLGVTPQKQPATTTTTPKK